VEDAAEERLQVQEEENDKDTVVNAPVGEQPALAEAGAEKVLPDIGGAGSTILSGQITAEPSISNGVDEKRLTEPENAQQEEEREKEKYRQCYVGDGTWEEKTWKELVRLREDMFWARVGRFRD